MGGKHLNLSVHFLSCLINDIFYSLFFTSFLLHNYLQKLKCMKFNPRLWLTWMKFLMCQDSANCNGGKWIIRFKKVVSGRFWEDLVRKNSKYHVLLIVYGSHAILIFFFNILSHLWFEHVTNCLSFFIFCGSFLSYSMLVTCEGVPPTFLKAYVGCAV